MDVFGDDVPDVWGGKKYVPVSVYVCVCMRVPFFKLHIHSEDILWGRKLKKALQYFTLEYERGTAIEKYSTLSSLSILLLMKD